MRFFNFTNKKNNMEEQNDMTKIDDILKSLSDDERKELRDRLKGDDTTEQIKEAREDIAEKGRDSQTEKDRIDESVAAQERNEGTRDSQTARDRVDEAEGEDRALSRRDEAYDARADISAIREEMRTLRELITAANSKPREVEDEKAKEALNKAKQLYLN